MGVYQEGSFQEGLKRGVPGNSVFEGVKKGAFLLAFQIWVLTNVLFYDEIMTIKMQHFLIGRFWHLVKRSIFCQWFR